jgi:hypothetical protein
MDIFINGHNTIICDMLHADVDRFLFNTSLLSPPSIVYDHNKTDFENHQTITEYIDYSITELSSVQRTKGYCAGTTESILQYIDHRVDSISKFGINSKKLVELLLSHQSFSNRNNDGNGNVSHLLSTVSVFEYGETSLTYAINSGNLSLFNKLLVILCNNNLDLKDRNGFTPLTCALLGCNSNTSIDQLPQRMKTSYYYNKNEFRSNCMIMANRLLQAGSNPNIPATPIIKIPNTKDLILYPLFLANKIPDKGKIFLKMLEAKDIDLTIKNHRGETITNVLANDNKITIVRSIQKLKLHRFYTQFIIAIMILMLTFCIIRTFF